jgi:N-methylhydantoinase B
VLVGQIQGGGGYGDPLARDPESVIRDLGQGLVSATAAREIYGVVVADGELDGAATAATRSAIRQARRADVDASATATIDGDVLHMVADTVAAVVLPDGGRHLRCETCHADLGTYESPYALSATTRDLSFSATGSRATGYDEDEYLLREYACPGCGTALLHEVQARSEPEPAAALSHLAP